MSVWKEALDDSETGEIVVLDVIGLRASAGDKEILRGISLTVNKGEVHAIMGPNGSGKSTLAQVLAGRQTELAPRLPDGVHELGGAWQGCPWIPYGQGAGP